MAPAGSTRSSWPDARPPRAGQTTDIARAAVYLASEAASFITGRDLMVDGGFVPFWRMGWSEAVAARAVIPRQASAGVERNL
jgi:NAD(P)-dependent dehydrogenase (short-subunit alcohol dehydrogenase family)